MGCQQSKDRATPAEPLTFAYFGGTSLTSMPQRTINTTAFNGPSASTSAPSGWNYAVSTSAVTPFDRSQFISFSVTSDEVVPAELVPKRSFAKLVRRDLSRSTANDSITREFAEDLLNDSFGSFVEDMPKYPSPREQGMAAGASHP